MQIKASEILTDFEHTRLIESLAGPDRIITGIESVESCAEGDLVFVDNADYVDKVVMAAPAAVVTTPKLAELFKDQESLSIMVSGNVRLASAMLRQAYVDRDCRDSEWGRVHPSAVVHESVVVPEDAVIGPGVVLGKDVVIGDGAVVMANTVIEAGAAIGNGTIIHPNVTLGYDCMIGSDCIIKSGCVIGMEGFGFAQDEKRKSHRIPQLGKVVIGDNVVLGANCNIDRATFGQTRIADGTKLDALCHIAHNVDIGEDCLLTAQTVIAGSTTLGRRIICSGQTGILDHLHVADDVVLVQRAGVISDIDKPGVYAGLPVQPVRDYFKNAALSRRLGEFRKQLDAMEKRVAELVVDGDLNDRPG